jgi:ABC-type bacteriocin/lantibiotic exporter with double-glycine peptidase domain
MQNITLINNLVEKYADLSNLKLNHFDLLNNKGRYTEVTAETAELFFSRLYDTGNYAQMVFTNNSLSDIQFVNFLEALSHPIIIFRKTDSLQPAILFRDKFLKVIYFNEDLISEPKVVTENEIIKDILNVHDLNHKFGYDYGKRPLETGRQVDYDLFFVTGIPVRPQLSADNNKEDGHHEHLSPVKRLLRLMTSERKEISYIYFFAILVGLVNLGLPLGIQSIISLISGGMLLESIIVLTIGIVAATGFAGYLQILQLRYVEVLQQRVFAKAAYEFSYRIPKIKLEAISKEYGPELVNRFFDVLNIQKALPKFLIDITAALLQIVFGLILLSFYHQFFIFFGFLLIAIIVLVIYFSGPKGLKSSITESKYKYKVAYWLEELARNITTFKLAGYTNLTIDKTDHYLSNYLIARQKHFRVLSTQYITIIIFKTFITASLLILGGLLVFQNQINIGQFIAAELIIVLIISAVEKLINTLDVIYDLLTAVDKVGHVTDLPLEEAKGIQLERIPNHENFTLEVKNLSYKYDGNNAFQLKNLNFSIKAGESVAIVGHNNAGKTTLIKILTGLYHQYQGQFTFNQIPLRDINIYSFRDTIGENISNNEIFEGTIEENITVGKRDISLENLMWAIEEVGLSDFLKLQPLGLRTSLVGSGTDLARNVRHKFILARSIAEKPKLLVMDDDFFTELHEKKAIVDLLFNKQNLWSLVVVSNDPVLLAKADKLLFLDEGTIKLQGKYEELMKNEAFSKLIQGN